jgi:alanine racemase
VHFKIDVGMGRIGFLYNYSIEKDEETISAIEKISKFEGIEIEGIFTHFPNADDKDISLTENHFSLFKDLIEKLENRGIIFEIKHCCNSAATMRFPKMHMDMVRPGIILYGCLPSEECKNKNVLLKPVMELKTRIVHIKTIGPGHPISYGGSFVTSKETMVATLPIGYADGFSRALGNKYKVLLGNSRVPILGKICMDQCMIDVTNVNTINVGDEVVIFGESIPVEEYSCLIGTINYETLCLIGIRVPRVYFENGKQVKVLNFLV